MRISLNILPEEHKRAMRRRKMLFRISIQIALLFGLFVFLGGILASVLFGMSFFEKAILPQTAAIEADRSEEIQKYDDLFLEKNREMKRLQTLFSDERHYTNVFGEMEEARSEGVFIERVSLSGEAGEIAGIAATREDALRFQGDIEGSDCFHSAEIPIDDLTKRERTVFVLTFSIEAECVLNSWEEV